MRLCVMREVIRHEQNEEEHGVGGEKKKKVKISKISSVWFLLDFFLFLMVGRVCLGLLAVSVGDIPCCSRGLQCRHYGAVQPGLG
jgi:hypothetical protein